MGCKRVIKSVCFSSGGLSIDPIVLEQREFYNSHKTLDINFRINALKTLKKAILAYEDRINEAIKMLENQILTLICVK